MGSGPAHRFKGKVDQLRMSHGKVENRGAPGTLMPGTRLFKILLKCS